MGRLDHGQIASVIREQQAGFNNCFNRSAGSYVSGETQLRFVVAKDGRVEAVSIYRSNLGAWQVEDCLLETARFLVFPPPEGGNRAQFAYPFTWNMAGRRLSTPVDAGWGYATLRKNRNRFRKCRRVHPFAQPFNLTVYVGRQGQPLSVGYDSRENPPAGFAACVVQVVEELRFPNPGPRIVKYRALVENLPDDR